MSDFPPSTQQKCTLFNLYNLHDQTIEYICFCVFDVEPLIG
jgi:hypothetical protein